MTTHHAQEGKPTRSRQLLPLHDVAVHLVARQHVIQDERDRLRMTPDGGTHVLLVHLHSVEYVQAGLQQSLQD